MMGTLLRTFNGFSYKEKSVLISLIALAAIYGTYFYGLLTGDHVESLGALLATMIGLVVTLIVVHVVFHVVISLDDVSEQDDERDRAISRRASTIGYTTLFVGVLAVMSRILILGARSEAAGGPIAPGPVEIVNLLLACLVVSEIVFYATQLFLYRRGVSW